MNTVKYLSTAMLACFVMSACSVSGRSAAKPAQPSKPITTQAPTPESGSSDISKAIAGEWVVTAVGTKVITTEDDLPYFTFVPADGKFYGNNGCNTVNGSYKLTPAGMISFSNVLSTMRYCPDVSYDSDINAVFNDKNTVATTFKTVGNEAYLTLSANGRQLMTLRRSNMDFLNGQWRVSDINGTAIDDEEANIFFDIYEKKVHGNTGCNFFNGAIMFDPAVANSISFSGMGVTRMACPKGDQERNMLVALEEASTVVRGGKDTVILLNSSGKGVITLKRMPITQQD